MTENDNPANYPPLSIDGQSDGTGADLELDGADPYATPPSGLTPDDELIGKDAVWRDGRLLVMDKEAKLPDRCIKCNQPAAHRIRQRLYWHSPFLYLLILLNLIVYVIVATIVRKNAVVSLPLCATHRSKRRKGIALAWLLFFASPVLFVLAIRGEPGTLSGVLAVLSSVTFLTCLVLAVVFSQTVVANRIDKTHLWLKRVSPTFLRDLKPAPPDLRL